MKVIRYNTISALPNVMKLHDYSFNTSSKFADSLADRTNFVPLSEQIKSLDKSGRGLSKAGDVGDSRFYDFPDGKDTGISVPVSRRKGADLAEISVSVRKDSKKISDAVSAAASLHKDIDALKKVVDTKVSSESVSNTSSSTVSK